MIGEAIRIIIAIACAVGANAVCDTYTTVCAVGLGQHLPFSPGLNYAKVSADEDFYVTFTVRGNFNDSSSKHDFQPALTIFRTPSYQMPADVQTAIVDLSVIFGSVRMFAAMNRKPAPSDFDFSNALTGQQDHLTIVSRN